MVINSKLHFNTITRDYYRSLNSPNRNVITYIHIEGTRISRKQIKLHGTKLGNRSRQNEWPFHFQDHKPINESLITF